MTSNETNFSKILDSISRHLNAYKDMSHDDLLTYCINQKLKYTLHQYGYDMDNSSDFLLKQSSTRVFKAMTKLQKSEDKEAILAAKDK